MLLYQMSCRLPAVCVLAINCWSPALCSPGPPWAPLLGTGHPLPSLCVFGSAKPHHEATTTASSCWHKTSQEAGWKQLMCRRASCTTRLSPVLPQEGHLQRPGRDGAPQMDSRLPRKCPWTCLSETPESCSTSIEQQTDTLQVLDTTGKSLCWVERTKK